MQYEIIPFFHLQRLMIQESATYGEIYTVLFVLLWQISDISYTRYNTLLLYSRQVEIEVYPPCLPCLSLAIIQFSSFRFRLIGSSCRIRFIGPWLYVPFRVLLWCFRLPCFTLACLLIARVYYALTLSHSVIIPYLQPLAVCQNRRAVLRCGCSLFTCGFFVE